MPDPDALQKGKQVGQEASPTLPQPPTLLQRLQAPLTKKDDIDQRHPKPDRVRAHDLEYEICRASAYSVRRNLVPCLALSELQLPMI